MTNDQNDANRRSQLLVKKRFQADYILVGVITVLLAVNILIISALLIMGGTAKLGFTVFHGAMIGLVELLLVGVVAWLGLKTSHTIAGPVLVLERNMERITNGDVTFRMTLRKSDHFQSSAGIYNSMAESLERRLTAAKNAAQRLERYADHSPELRKDIEALNRELAHFKTDAETGKAGSNGNQD